MTRQRLIDLRIDWLAQYRGETVGSGDPLPRERLARLDGYLGSTRAAFLIDDTPTTPAAVVDAWLARAQAEFPGRVLADPDDLARWQSEPDSLCWAVLALGPGFAADPSQQTDDRLDTLISRGIRVFPAAGEFYLERLHHAATRARRTLALDLADLPPDTLAATLDRLAADAALAARFIPIVTRATEFDPALTARIAALEGLLALTLPALRNALPDLLVEHATLLPSIAVATDFPDDDDPTTAESIARELSLHPALLAHNAARLIARLASPVAP
jgi:hypothetical protein